MGVAERFAFKWRSGAYYLHSLYILGKGRFLQIQCLSRQMKEEKTYSLYGRGSCTYDQLDT